jgi:16S rRNA (cytosine967-C5)-methyltransferase
LSAGPTASAAEAIAKVSPSRAAAFEILTLVGEGKGHSDELLHSPLASELTPEDRNLATALVMGALSESVEICRAAGHSHATGMVNAVLRKLAAEASSQKRGIANPSPRRAVPLFESTATFAERLAHPRWLVDRWVAQYGREAALAICEYDQQEPQPGGVFLDAAADMPQMDDGSRLVAEIAAAAVPPVAERALRVWDCCAAPGGKTLLLALRLQAAEILASDISAKRLAHMSARLQRYAYAQRIKTAVTDASSAQADLNRDLQFDLILCDVPCSGTGTLARNPEIRHRLRPEDLARQATRQRAILSGALQRLAPGGRIVYSTCSLEPEENERVVEAMSNSGLRRVPTAPLIDSLARNVILTQDAAATLTASALRDGALRTLPGVHSCDGFFAVVLERC